MQQRLVNRGVLILLLIAITLLFLAMVKPFLQAVFVAALFAALFSPLYRKILDRVGERRGLASALTLITIILFVMVPLILLLGAVTSQALDIADTAVPWVRQQLGTPGLITESLKDLPFYSAIEPYRDQALARLGALAGTVSGWAVTALQSATLGTFSVLLSVMIVLYTLFFFLIDGDRLLYYMLYYLPLDDDDETKLLQRFTSVTRATLKGTAVIGFLQGALAGLALYFAGIPSALFWAAAMMVLSVVPGVGTALVWIPAVIYLVVGGQYFEAAAVGIFCVIVVGTVDNLLRPKLVGKQRYPVARTADLFQHAGRIAHVRVHGVCYWPHYRRAVCDLVGAVRRRIQRLVANHGIQTPGQTHQAASSEVCLASKIGSAESGLAGRVQSRIHQFCGRNSNRQHN